MDVDIRIGRLRLSWSRHGDVVPARSAREAEQDAAHAARAARINGAFAQAKEVGRA
jgi:hypothetical protein